MSEILFHYKRVDPTTWAYLTSLLTVALFFKFNRFWSVRNLDLVLIMLLGPGLLLVQFGVTAKYEAAVAHHQASESSTTAPPGDEGGGGAEADDGEDEPRPADPSSGVNEVTDTDDSSLSGDDGSEEEAPPATSALQTETLESIQRDFDRADSIERLGFIWLLSTAGMLCIRLLIDPNMVRRPLLEPNLNAAGLMFLCLWLFLFLMANVLTSSVDEQTIAAQDIRQATAELRSEPIADVVTRAEGPQHAVLILFPRIPTVSTPESASVTGFVNTARALAILSHLAIVIGIAGIGYRHFDSLQMGVGAATLYLMLPYTAQMTGHIDHSIPGALIIWAVLSYRRPLWAGMFLGLAAGGYYYPLFLLPLWISFYWQRGLMRFLSSFLTMIAALVGLLIISADDVPSFLENVRKMFGLWTPLMSGLGGIWGHGWDPWFRVPVVALFVGLSGTLAIWPPQKNLGTLLSCSAAVMAATQFWHGFGGGLYLAWFMPLVLLTFFRPNLEDRIALSVLGEGWFPRRRRAA